MTDRTPALAPATTLDELASEAAGLPYGGLSEAGIAHSLRPYLDRAHALGRAELVATLAEARSRLLTVTAEAGGLRGERDELARLLVDADAERAALEGECTALRSDRLRSRALAAERMAERDRLRVELAQAHASAELREEIELRILAGAREETAEAKAERDRLRAELAEAREANRVLHRRAQAAEALPDRAAYREATRERDAAQRDRDAAIRDRHRLRGQLAGLVRTARGYREAGERYRETLYQVDADRMLDACEALDAVPAEVGPATTEGA